MTRPTTPSWRVLACALALAGLSCEGLAQLPGPSTGGGGAASGGGLGTGGGVATGGGAGGGAATGGGGAATGGGSPAGGGVGGGAGGGAAAGFTPGPTGCQALAVEANVSLPGGYRADRYGWSDAACRPRTAALVRNDAADPGGSSGGYLRAFTYEAAPGTVRTATATGGSGWNGFGYVVTHYGGSYDSSSDKTGTFRTVLGGPHHALHEFKLRINPGGPVDVTVRWFFATGRGAPIYAITYDASPAGADVVAADSRAPYGELAFEGTPGDIGGVGWGDAFRFTTTGAGPVTPASAWSYTAPNTVPHVRMWAQGTDAEMGAVQTQAFSLRIGGGDYGGGLVADCQGKTSATKLAGCSGSSGWTLPQDWLWPFQLNQYELPFTTQSHRLAWGLTYGSVGQRSVSAFGRTTSGYPTLAYAVAVVLGLHSTEATLAEVTAMERRLAATVSAGAWVEAFAGWELAAAAGGTTWTLDPRGGAVSAPVFHLTGFAGAAPSLVSVGGVALAAGQGHFASKDASDGSLWLTLNGTVTAPVTIRVE